MRFVTPKETMTLSANIFGFNTSGVEMNGLHTDVLVTHGSRWSCRKVGKYYHLTRKGTGVIIRCTEAALHRHFVEIKKGE